MTNRIKTKGSYKRALKALERNSNYTCIEIDRGTVHQGSTTTSEESLFYQYLFKFGRYGDDDYKLWKLSEYNEWECRKTLLALAIAVVEAGGL